MDALLVSLFYNCYKTMYRTNTIDYNMATSTITATVYNHYAMV